MKNCVFCNKPFPKRKVGDHVVPQGLGQFKPEATLDCVCIDCDSKHGNGYEKNAIRTGLIAFFKFINGIQSKNNKRRPPHNPQKDRFNSLESKEFLVQDANNQGKSIELRKDGKLQYANEIVVIKNGKEIDSINIPTFDNLRDTCNPRCQERCRL